jgi:hypothetical protein
MAAHETILAHVLSVAQLRSGPALAAIGRELDRDPELRFQRFGTSDPPRAKIDSAEAALGSWRPGTKDEHRAWSFFLSRPADPAGRASLDITTMDPTKARYAHDISTTYRASHFTNAERLEQIADLLRRLAEASGAFYGRAALGAIYDQHNLIFERAGRPPTDFERELPDVFWLNYLGPGYVSYFGDRLRTLGVRRESTKTGGLLIWATETPFVLESVRSVADYAWKRPFYDALGRETFRSETERRGVPGDRVPMFPAHRRN